MVTTHRSSLRRCSITLPRYRRIHVLFVSSLFCLCSIRSFIFAQEIDESKVAESREESTIRIPDGMPIHLRFAQPVCGSAPGLNVIAAKKGAVVPLVVSRDLWIDDKIIVAKGALAQATITRVLPIGNTFYQTPNWGPFIPGVSIQVDWVVDVTGNRIALRARERGAATAVELMTMPTKNRGGVEVQPFPMPAGLFGVLCKLTPPWWRAVPQPLVREGPKNICIPNRTRMLAYTHGGFSVNARELEEAQATLPAPNENATLYAFRVQDKNEQTDPAPPFFCGDVNLGSLRSHQMAVANLSPGRYSCRIGKKRSRKLSLEAGGEYYVQIRREPNHKWSFLWVDEEDGEDLTADLDVVPVKPAGAH